MKSTRRPDPKLLTILTLLAVLATACVRPDAPGVAISKLEANLVFGVKIPEKPAAPTPLQIAQIVTPAVEAEPELPVDELAELPEPEPLPELNLEPATPVSDCPVAPPTAAAERVANLNVDHPVEMGSYKFKRSGEVMTAQGPAVVRGTERRLFRKFVQSTTDVSTFEIVQPSLSAPGRFTVNTFQVNTNALHRDTSPGGSSVVTGPRVGDPERGVVLLKTETVDAEGFPVPGGQPFEPTTGLLLLPLPVQGGETYESVAIDAKNGVTVVHEASVVRRQRIDACGEVLDGWLVEATQRWSNQIGEIKYDYVIAPQYGGVLISERTRLFDVGAETPVLDITFSIAQLRPDPLPSGA